MHQNIAEREKNNSSRSIPISMTYHFVIYYRQKNELKCITRNNGDEFGNVI
jgi:hypothetical protein